MWWVDHIFSLVWDISDWFRSAYETVEGWWWPFNYLARPLYGIWQVTRWLLTPIAHFSDWSRSVWDRIVEIFSLEQIRAYFQTWINYAVDAWNWIRSAWWNVTSIIYDWWSYTRSTVQGWIEAARQFVMDMIAPYVTMITKMQESWDLFWTDTWPTILNSKEIQGLIDASLLPFTPVISTFQVFQHAIVAFFTSPFEWLFSQFESWFWGEEET